MLSRTLVLISALAAITAALPYNIPNGYAAPAYYPVYQRIPASIIASYGYNAPGDLVADFKELEANLNNTATVEKKFNGSVEDAVGLVPYSEALIKTMKKITEKIKNGPQLELLEAANVGTEMLEFLPKSVEVIKNLASKKPLFDKLGVTSVVLQQLVKERDQAQKLDDALYAKIPELAKDQAKDMWTPVKAEFDKVIKDFGGDELDDD